MRGAGVVSSAIAAAALAAGAALCAEPAERGEFGKPVKDFALRDVSTGTEHRLSQYSGKVVLVCFLGNRCAMVDRHLDRIGKAAADYSAKGVVFLGVNSNADEPADTARQYAADKKLPLPLLKDPGNVVADYFAAKFTPQFLVIDGKGVWRYTGAFDDNPFPESVKIHYVRAALDAALLGKDPPTAETKAYGCKIAREKK